MPLQWMFETQEKASSAFCMTLVLGKQLVASLGPVSKSAEVIPSATAEGNNR